MKSFLRFLWNFFVGDDPAVAAGVVVTLGVTALVATTSVPAWWIVPVAVAGLLAASLWRAAS
jgi:hypothetical protein